MLWYYFIWKNFVISIIFDIIFLKSLISFQYKQLSVCFVDVVNKDKKNRKNQ